MHYLISHRRILSLIMELTCTEIIVQSRMWKKLYEWGKCQAPRELRGEKEYFQPERLIQSTSSTKVLCVFLYSGLNLRSWAKEKETDHLDSVMSSDDCNMAIRAGSLEEEVQELQASEVSGGFWADKDGLHLDLIIPAPSSRRERNRGLLTSLFDSPPRA